MSRFTIVLVAIAACMPSVPDQPSFQLDVLPLLAANCLRCHGTPALYDVPPEFRLDVFGDTVIDADETIEGAAAWAATIAYRTSLDERQMPPRFPLQGWQIEMFERWAENPVRGEPRAANRPPHVAIERSEHTADRVALRVRIDDTDGDPVGGELRVTLGTEDRHVGRIRSGVLDVAWTTTGIPAGDYPLTAHVDDGAQVHVIPLGALTIGGP